MKGEKKMKEKFKRVIFAIIIVALILVLGVVIKTGKLKKLEGYMYSFAAEITDSATDSNATSSNVQGCATSSNATSSNAKGCATSSDATSSNAQGCATSSDAKSDNTQVTETIKVTNTQTESKQNTSTPSTSQTKKEPEEVKTETKKTAETGLIYNNSEITPEILEKISNNTKLQNITINLDENVNISRDVFMAIKEKNIKLTVNTGENQIIFDGNNIEITKDINAEISYNLVNKDSLLKEIVQEGVVINFANNGELPGTALIRIKATEELKQALDMDTILVYYYNEETKELTQMTDDAIYNEDGYIEFSINHNSKYLLVNKLIEEKEYSVTTTSGDVKEKDKVSFLESHKMYVIIIGVSILAIIVVVVILIVDKKVKNKKDDKNNKDEKID